MGLSRLPAVPDADWSQVGWTIFGGALTRWQAVGDNNSATGIQATAFNSVYTATVGDPGLPAGSVISGLTAECRALFVAPGRVDIILLIVWLPTLAVIAQSAVIALYDYENTGAFFQTPGVLARPDGQPFTVADVTDNVLVQVQAFPYDAATAKVTQLQVGVYHNQPPTVAITTPTPAQTLTTTANPTLAGAYTDPEGDPVERLHLKVFSGTGAVDPDTETARLVYEALVYANGFSHYVTKALDNGGYRWAARASDAGSSAFSAWVQSTFTINVPAPAAPTVSAAVWDAAGQRVALTAALPSIASGPMPDWYEIEQSLDAGATWQPAMDRFPVPNAVPLVGSMTLQRQDRADASRYWTLDTNATNPAGASVTTTTTGDLVSAFSVAAGDVIVRQSAGLEAVVVAGRTYRMWMFAAATVGSRNFAMTVEWLNAAGGVISSTTSANTLVSSAAAQDTTPFDATAPAGAVKARLKLIMRAAAAANEWVLFGNIRMVDTSISVYDERAPRKASVQVRIRSRRRPLIWSQESSPPSAWVTNTVQTATDGKTWLKSFATPALNAGFRLDGDADLESASEGRAGLFAVWGQRGYTPTFAVPLGWRASIALALENDAQLAQVEALYRSGGVVLLQTDKGESPRRQVWVALVGMGMVERSRSAVGTVERQWRTVRLDVAEVVDPLTVV